VNRKYEALMRMKCRARGVPSNGDVALDLHEISVRTQRHLSAQVNEQTMLMEQQVDIADRAAEAQERIAKNSTILLWIVVAFIVLDAITAVLT
jgi:hypothetical protein